jgi:hypothetical protein
MDVPVSAVLELAHPVPVQLHPAAQIEDLGYAQLVQPGHIGRQ